jgi:outer membrane protein assembly factor BamD (BamD/ComL family)
VRTPVKRRPAPTPAPNPTDATAHAELSLLRGAQSALAAGNPARALQQLDRHASSFPDSLLAEEREVARIRALCDLGRTTQAHAAQKKFLQAFAGSPLAGQAAKACDDTGSEDGP